MRLAFALVTAAALSACLQADELLQDTVRQQAKIVVNGLVTERFPGLNAAPITDCVIDNASVPEILTLGQAAIVGVTPETTQVFTSIATRPDTLTCIASGQLGMFGQ